jgi:hypothetical protein
MRTTTRHQEGAALAMALLILIIIFGIAESYFILSMGGWENSDREVACVRSRLAAEDGLSLSIAELKSGTDVDGDGLGNLTATAVDGRQITVTAVNLGPTSYVNSFLYQLHSVAVLRRAQCGADLVAEIIPPQPIDFEARAAITSNGPVLTTGSITVDGRDWNLNGTAVVGPGTFGISSTSTITNTGSSSVGGAGMAPDGPPPPGAQEPIADWSDGADQDGDGSVDEENFDGIDNDDDGLIDEDTSDYPSTPDVALHLPEGTLRDAAIASNTYYTSQTQLDAAIAANGNKMPGGVVIYLDFPLWEPADLGNQFNSPPSVLVHHNATGNALMKNVHGRFVGLVFADLIDHLNGDVEILGALMTFASGAGGNAYGNGNAHIKLCTAALENLPEVGQTQVKIRSWSRATAQ